MEMSLGYLKIRSYIPTVYLSIVTHTIQKLRDLLSGIKGYIIVNTVILSTLSFSNNTFCEEMSQL